jgi:uncharacterized membrane protein
MRSDEESGRGGHRLEAVEGLDGTGSDMSRLISVSDGVFAFSLTFLVIELVIPQKLASGNYPNLSSYLAGEQTALIAYALAFWIIASWWGSHHRLFSPIVRYDGLLVRLNTVFLMIIAVTPFLVGILTEYGASADFSPGSQSTQIAVALYGGVQAVGGLTLLAIWRHSTRGHRLVRASLPPAWIRATEQSQLTNVLVFAASVPVAFVVPFLSEVMWILVIIGLRHFRAKTSALRNDPAHAT